MRAILSSLFSFFTTCQYHYLQTLSDKTIKKGFTSTIMQQEYRKKKVFIECFLKSIQLVETTRSHSTEFDKDIKTLDMPLHQQRYIHLCNELPRTG